MVLAQRLSRLTNAQLATRWMWRKQKNKEESMHSLRFFQNAGASSQRCEVDRRDKCHLSFASVKGCIARSFRAVFGEQSDLGRAASIWSLKKKRNDATALRRNPCGKKRDETEHQNVERTHGKHLLCVCSLYAPVRSFVAILAAMFSVK